MKIFVLIENTAMSGLECEHGLSLMCEFGGKKYLFDSGASSKFAGNAKAMGIDLNSIACAALSHSHHDHCSGFDEFFTQNANAPLYIRTEADEGCYAEKADGIIYIGISENLADSPRVKRTLGKTEIGENVWLLPHRSEGYPEKGARAHMLRKDGDSYKTDDFMHEQTLVFDTDKGLIVLSSCSHIGAENVIREAMESFPEKPVAAFIGGLHLMSTGGPDTLAQTEEEVKALGRFLCENVQGPVYTGHCTGTPGYAILSEVMGAKLNRLTSGLEITI